jgi:hypothetical protein
MFLLLFLLNLSCNPFSNDSSLESNRGYSVNRTVKLESDSDKVIIADGEDSIYLSAENYQLYYKENGIEKRVEQNMFSTKKGGIYNFYTKDRVKVQGSVIAISKNVLKDEYSMYVKDVEKTKDKNYFNLNNRYRKYFSYRIEDINKDEKDIRDNLDDNSLINALENNLNDVEYISQEVEVYVRDRVFKKIKITIHSIDIMYSIDDDSNESSIFAKPGPILVNAKDNNSSIKFRSTRNISADISSMENITYQDGKMTFDLKKGVNRVKFYFYEEKKRVDFAEKIIYNLDIPEVIYPENKNYVMYGETCNINIDDFIKNVGEDKIKFSEETEKQFITYIENNSIVCTPALIKGHKNPDEEVVVDVEIKYLNDVILTLPIKVKGYAEKNLSKWPGLINGGNYCYYNAGLKGFLAAYGDLIKINNKDEEIKDTTKRILKSLWSAMNLGNKDAIRRGYAENDKGLWYLLRDYLNENSEKKIKNVQKDSYEYVILQIMDILGNDFSDHHYLQRTVEIGDKKIFLSKRDRKYKNYIVNNYRENQEFKKWHFIFNPDLNWFSFGVFDKFNDEIITDDAIKKRDGIFINKKNDKYYFILSTDSFEIPNVVINSENEENKDSTYVLKKKEETLFSGNIDPTKHKDYLFIINNLSQEEFISFCEKKKNIRSKLFWKNDEKVYNFNLKEVNINEIIRNNTLEQLNVYVEINKNEIYREKWDQIGTMNIWVLEECIFAKTPEVINLSFSRYDSESGRPKKNNADINISYTVSIKDENNIEHFYDLVSALKQIGNINGGHYVSYIKTDSKWYEHNDSSVKVISDENAERSLKQSYALFYKKRSSNEHLK